MTVQAKTMDVKTMDVKKTQQSLPAVPKEPPVPMGKKIRDFFGDVKSELKKINWTSYDELRVYTKIVVVATFLFGMGIYVMDLLIQTSLSVLEYFIRLISG